MTRLRKLAGPAALWLWFAAMLVLGTSLLARHAVAMPGPAGSPALVGGVEALRTPATRGKWLAVHVLYAECTCSQRIVAHLVSSARPADWAEVVLWVGDAAPSAALEQRFDVRRVSVDDLGRLGVEAAPLLVASAPDGQIRYAAGYTDRKQGPVIDDLRLPAEARDAAVVSSLPIFGCAVSARLQRELRSLSPL